MKRHILIILLIGFSAQGQKLHHQMLSSHGATKVLPNGIVVKQTIGQQSTTGNSDNNYVVMQGFQQSVWGKYIATNNTVVINAIKTTTYPNPFTETVNFQFSEPITDLITITVFDILGRLIFEQKKVSVNTILTINLAQLSSSEYLIRLNASKFSYYTKIIKK
jgi:hypothetical protein